MTNKIEKEPYYLNVEELKESGKEILLRLEIWELDERIKMLKTHPFFHNYNADFWNIHEKIKSPIISPYNPQKLEEMYAVIASIMELLKGIIDCILNGAELLKKEPKIANKIADEVFYSPRRIMKRSEYTHCMLETTDKIFKMADHIMDFYYELQSFKISYDIIYLVTEKREN